MKIVVLSSLQPDLLDQAARLLVEAFREHWSNAWSDMDAARSEIKETLEEEKIALAAVDEAGLL